MSDEALERIAELRSQELDLAGERELIGLLGDLDLPELAGLLVGDGAYELAAALSDHRLGEANRTALFSLLTTRPLGPAALAGVVHAGHALGGDSRFAVTALTQTRGSELTQLKNALARQCLEHDLAGLVHQVLDDDERETVLSHFREQAAELGGPRGVKVLCDIDDTIFPSIYDNRLPQATVYPGVLAFLRALDEGPDDQPASGDLTFVTGRPADPLGIVEGRLRETLAQAGLGECPVLTGSLLSLRSASAVSHAKVDNVAAHATLFPEYEFVFVGDSGQGDLETARGLREQHGSTVRAVFVQDVVDTPESERDELATEGIWFHDTWLGAANRALRLGLVSPAGHTRVLEETVRGMDDVAWESEGQRDWMQQLVDRDVLAAARLSELAS